MARRQQQQMMTTTKITTARTMPPIEAEVATAIVRPSEELGVDGVEVSDGVEVGDGVVAGERERERESQQQLENRVCVTSVAN